jgi:hypothetical protein
MTPGSIVIVFMLALIARELRLIRARLGGHLKFLPFKED